MIESILLENFRIWGGRHEIPLRPLTCIYGPNSSGKSSIMYGLLVLRQTLENADGPQVYLKSIGKYADVGDFKNLIHSHNAELTLRLGLAFRGNRNNRSVERKDTLRRITLEFKSFGSLQGMAKLEKFTIEIASDTALTFCAEMDGFGLEESGGSKFRDYLVDSLHPVMKDNLSDSFESSLGMITDRMKFEFKNGMPSRMTWMDHSEVTDEQKLDLDQLSAAWLSLADHLREELFNQLSRFRHIGPLRQPLSRIMTHSGQCREGKGVGTRGENIVELLASLGDQEVRFRGEKKKLIEQINDCLSSMCYDYSIDLETTDKLNGIGVLRILSLQQKSTGTWANPFDVGSGISQSLPIVIQLLSEPSKSHFIEQPEVHIHPSLQVELAQLMVDIVNEIEYNTQIVCETHSPEILLRILGEVKSKNLNNQLLSLLYIEPPLVALTDTTKCLIMEVNEYGSVKKPWPGGFFPEREAEARGYRSGK